MASANNNQHATCTGAQKDTAYGREPRKKRGGPFTEGQANSTAVLETGVVDWTDGARCPLSKPLGPQRPSLDDVAGRILYKIGVHAARVHVQRTVDNSPATTPGVSEDRANQKRSVVQCTRAVPPRQLA